MKIKNAIFDMDGLMFDTEKLFRIAHDELAKKYNAKFTLEIQSKMMGKKSLEAVEVMCSELNLSVEPKALQEERNVILANLFETQVRLMPGLLELLNLLDSFGVRKGIATSANRERAHTLLNKFDLTKRFEVIVTGEDVNRGKPDPEIYLLALSKLNAEPSKTIVFEDASNGIQSAKRAGCIAVSVPHELTAHQDFSMANLVANSLSDPKIRNLIE